MFELEALEIRVVGALLEKEITTPEQYPLTLKSLTLACNQKSNREPVTALSETQVKNVVDDLTNKNLVSEVVFGTRVSKYRHRFCNTEFSKLHFDGRELAVLCVLFLRGPNTPGELRSRTNRLANFADVHEVDETLSKLVSREDGPFVVKLNREPGKRESRFAHLFSGETISIDPIDMVAEGVADTRPGPRDYETRVQILEEELAKLRQEFDELRRQWRDLND